MKLFLLLLASAGALFPQGGAFTLKSEVRLVEVHATIMDQNGRYVDGLARDDFEVRENGAPQPVEHFERETQSLSCAVLLDTTGSMKTLLPVVKNSIVRLIDRLNDTDQVAIFTFADGLNQELDFTDDRPAAKRAVLRTRAAGTTALFDAISQTAREISKRSGKKALIVFTDGLDNASALNGHAATLRARRVGVPVYVLAQGEAAGSKQLLNTLEDITRATGGRLYRTRKASDIEEIFESISADLRHTYLLAYRPPAVESKEWRSVELVVKKVAKAQIRAKQGYFPE